MTDDIDAASPVALITGVAGQDGTYLSELLVSKGWQVHGVARSDPQLTEAGRYLRGVAVHVQDVADTKATEALIDRVEPDYVFHLAGISSVWKSWRDPVLTTRVNGLSVVGVLEASLALQERVGKKVTVVNASSAEIYAGSGVSPQNEDTPTKPTSPYGASKAFAHHMVQVYRARGLQGSNAILYNHESPRRPDTFVTRKVIDAAKAIAAGRQDVVELGDLSVVRDWGWAPQYVDALLRMAVHDGGEDFVLATGVGSTLRAFVERAFLSVGIEKWQRHVVTAEPNVRPADAPALIGDASRAHASLGWRSTCDLDALASNLLRP